MILKALWVEFSLAITEQNEQMIQKEMLKQNEQRKTNNCEKM